MTSVASNEPPEAPENAISQKYEVCDDARTQRQYLRRKRRRKLQRMIHSAQGSPSFLHLITANYDNSDDEKPEKNHNTIDEPEELERSDTLVRLPKRIKVDVDARMGLKDSIGNGVEIIEIEDTDEGSKSRWDASKVSSNPADEGWYEGTSPVALPEDEAYLSPLTAWARQHLEFFSVTPNDGTVLQGGRRRPTVGRVGVRCIECARAMRDKIMNSFQTQSSLPPLNETTGQHSSEKPETAETGIDPKDMEGRSRIREEENRDGSIVPEAVASGETELKVRDMGEADDDDDVLEPLDPANEESYDSDDAHQDDLGNTSDEFDDKEDNPLAAARRSRRPRASRDSVGLPTTRPRRTGSAESIKPIQSAILESVSLAGINKQGSHFSWPPSSVSFPSSIESLSTLFQNKIASHFQSQCPFLSRSQREELSSLIRCSHGKRTRSSLAVVTYITIAAKRIGLVDHICSSEGIRFGREVSLEPLPFETIKHQVEAQQHQQAQYVNAEQESDIEVSSQVAADPSAERVLAQSLLEEDNEARPCRSTDKALVTDYMFLTLKQMAICNANPSDTSSRNRCARSNPLVLGYAGFCCRYCRSGRAFPSAAVNLVSAISNSFASHLQTCPATSTELKKAILAYNKLHTRQIAALPYGAQRRYMYHLWDRLRASDKTEEEMKQALEILPHEESFTPDSVQSYNVASVGNLAPTSEGATVVTEVSDTRPAFYPVSQDETTARVISEHEEKWSSPVEVDALIQPSDRYLVSDFVFLTMRQLRPTMPVTSGRRTGRLMNPKIAGLSCIHCQGREHQVSPSGSSFPTAPDNFASALNTGFYNHMQNCFYIPGDLKAALASTRKLHSSQCSSLKFGSQRKFFNLLFARLGRYREKHANEDLLRLPSSSLVPQSDSCSGTAFSEHGFLDLTPPNSPALVICQTCQNVPIQFRAKHAVFTHIPSVSEMTKHVCCGDKISLSRSASLLEDAIKSYCSAPVQSVINSVTFRNLVRLAVGNDETMTMVFTDHIREAIENGEAEGAKSETDWTSFPQVVDSTRVAAALNDFIAEYAAGKECLKLKTFILSISPYSLATQLSSQEEATDRLNLPRQASSVAATSTDQEVGIASLTTETTHLPVTSTPTQGASDSSHSQSAPHRAKSQ